MPESPEQAGVADAAALIARAALDREPSAEVVAAVDAALASGRPREIFVAAAVFAGVFTTMAAAARGVPVDVVLDELAAVVTGA